MSLFNVNQTIMTSRADARKTTRSILLASIAARIAAATVPISEPDSSSDSESDSGSDDCYSSTDSISSTSTFTTVMSSTKAPTSTTFYQQKKPVVFVDTSKTTVTAYRYAEGCSTVLTGGVMLGSAAASAAKPQQKAAIWTRPATSSWRSRASAATPDIGSWRRSINV